MSFIWVCGVSACRQAVCNQRGQTANGTVTFWLPNVLWPIWKLSLLRRANRWSRPTPPSPFVFYKGELHADEMDACVRECPKELLMLGNLLVYTHKLWVCVHILGTETKKQIDQLSCFCQHGTLSSWGLFWNGICIFFVCLCDLVKLYFIFLTSMLYYNISC